MRLPYFSLIALACLPAEGDPGQAPDVPASYVLVRGLREITVSPWFRNDRVRCYRVTAWKGEYEERGSTNEDTLIAFLDQAHAWMFENGERPC